MHLFLQISAQEGIKRRLYGQFISDLKLLARFDLEVVGHFMDINLTTRKLPIGSDILRQIEKYLQDFYGAREYSKDSNASENISMNPVCAFRIIRRVKYLLQNSILKALFRVKFGDELRRIVLFLFKNGWIKTEDFEFIIDSILRLASVYNVDANKFAMGQISETHITNSTLNSIHCYEIATVAIQRENFVSAIEWLELAKEKNLADQLTSLPFVEILLRKAIDEHNMYFEEDLMMDLEPNFFSRKITYMPNDSKNAIKLQSLQYEAFKGKKGKRDKYYQVNYLGLCSGRHFQTDEEKLQLFCWNEFKIHPSFRIGPIKMEFWARNPDIVQIYEILHESEIETIISDTSPNMAVSKFVGKKTSTSDGRGAKLEIADRKVRSSVNTWFTGSESMKLSQKIERITGLLAVSPSAAEQLQIASYSLGGHNSPHSDSDELRKVWTEGPRIATFMFYLNDVEEGGSTAFTSLGVAAKPSKGSALFWYNVFSDGTTDWDVIHGACPVLIGEKWVANKWIHFYDQFLLRKCGMRRKERFQIPVNNMIT
ncbi:unnamed protein product [Allacma fusca]|uniref:procollagen-proline 4-dioxygenase n=1 Tax=Allacma fusca TaxID=39272 RepID=A0A8J2P326_9HEXA|nr:unnamed protein product [Allacma fusca]